ncbi:Plasmodium exported protein (PHIST), unknown function [Plasmodium berghei]|uniref:Plasmodium RESA N-terminal domain-containing protein n=1 Tax=Plasmodium berghei TaxID=5821 RepID=A0A0Y9YMV9_PLABE|nr:Plasmodium exported protein (PHIST), unknown function [Plasmodium berghei]
MDSGKLPIIILPSSGPSVSLINKNVNDRKLKKGNRRGYRKNSFERFNLASAFYKVILAFGIIIVVFLDNDSIYSNSGFSRITKEGRNLSEAIVPDETPSTGFVETGVSENDENHGEKNDNDSTHATSFEDSNKSESSHTYLDTTKEKENEENNDSKGNVAQNFQKSNISSNQVECTDDVKLTETDNYDKEYEQNGDEHYYAEKKYKQESYDQNILHNPDIQHALSMIPSDSIIKSFLHTSLTISPEDDEIDNPYREKTQHDIDSMHFTQWVDYMKYAVQEVDQDHEQGTSKQLPDTEPLKPEQKYYIEPSKPEQEENIEPLKPEQEENVDPLKPEQEENIKPLKPEQKENIKPLKPEQEENIKPLKPEQEENVDPLKPEQEENVDPLKPEQEENIKPLKPEQEENVDPLKPEQEENVNPLKPEQEENIKPLKPEQKENIKPLKPEQEENVDPLKPEQEENVDPLKPEQEENIKPLKPEQKENIKPLKPEQEENVDPLKPEQDENIKPLKPEQEENIKPLKPEQEENIKPLKPEQEVEYAPLNNKFIMESKNNQKKQLGHFDSSYDYNLDIIDETEMNLLFEDSKSYSDIQKTTNNGSHYSEKEPLSMRDEPSGLYKNKTSGNSKGSNPNVRGNEEVSMGIWDGLKPSSMSRSQGMTINQYPSTSGTQGITINQYPSTSGTQGMTRNQYPSTSGTQGMTRNQYPSTSGTQGMTRNQYPSTSGTQGMTRNQYPSTSGTQGMTRNQYPSTSGTQGMTRNQLIGEMYNIDERKIEEPMWLGLKSSYKPTPRKPYASNFSDMETFPRENYSRNKHEAFDRFDSHNMPRGHSTKYPTRTSSEFHNPMNRYNSRGTSNSGSILNSMKSLRGNDSHRLDNGQNYMSEPISTTSMGNHKLYFGSKNTQETISTSFKSKSNDYKGLDQQNKASNYNSDTDAVIDSKEVSETNFSPRKSPDAQIKEMNDHINEKIDMLDENATPDVFRNIWTIFISAETKKLMMTQEYVLQYSIYLQKRNKLYPEMRTAAWWKVHYSMINKFIKREKEEVSELKELLKSSTNTYSNFVTFIRNKMESWKEFQKEIKDTWLATLTYKINKYSSQDNY